jgi:SAM-dependent methyltransferase
MEIVGNPEISFSQRQRVIHLFQTHTLAAITALALATTALANTAADLVSQSQALAPLVKSEAAKEFLNAASQLPKRDAREIYVDAKTRNAITPTRWSALPDAQKSAYKKVNHDEAFYYATYYGSPMAYVRAIDVAAQFGVKSLREARVLDIGYGAIGGMQLMAYAGAQVSALDVDSLLTALYNQREDQGIFQNKNGGVGSLKLYDGLFAGDAALTKAIGSHFDLIVAKNTLKRGFMRPLPGKKAFVDFGATDEVFLRAIRDALAPGGIALLYNIAGAFNPERPSTDGRSPFTRDALEAAGFAVLAFDTNDDTAIRAIGAALGWQKDMGDLEKNLFALFTVVQKPK